MQVDFKPRYFALHFNGQQHAAFLTANAALAFQRGEDSTYFHIVDTGGVRVALKDQPGRPGHAYSIAESLGAS